MVSLNVDYGAILVILLSVIKMKVKENKENFKVIECFNPLVYGSPGKGHSFSGTN